MSLLGAQVSLLDLTCAGSYRNIPVIWNVYQRLSVASIILLSENDLFQFIFITLNVSDISRSMTKPTKLLVRPVKTQITPRVGSESSMCALRIASKDPRFLHAHMSFCWFYHSQAHIGTFR